MGKVQSALMTITFVAWTSNVHATCSGSFTVPDPAINEQCDDSATANLGDCCDGLCQIAQPDGTTCSAAAAASLYAVWTPLKEAYDAAQLDGTIAAANDALFTNITDAYRLYADDEIVKQSDADKELLRAEIKIAKDEAIIAGLDHPDNWKQSHQADYASNLASQMQASMQANMQSAKADIQKVESAADDAEESAKQSAISALDSKNYSNDAEKIKDDADDILSSIKKLVEGWIGHSHGGGCQQPPCSSPCQYSAMNPMYYYHC